MVTKDKFIGVLRTPQMKMELDQMKDLIEKLKKTTNRIQSMHTEMMKKEE